MFQLSDFADLACVHQQTAQPPWRPGVTCSHDDTDVIRDFGAAYMEQISALLDGPGLQRGLYLTSCLLHNMDFNYLAVGGTSPNVAFNAWYTGVRASPAAPPIVENNFKWVDDLALPRTDNPLACPPYAFTQ